MTAHQREVVFCDDRACSPILGCPVIAADEVQTGDELFIAVANPAARRRIAKRFEKQPFADIRAPSAVVAPHVDIGPGAFFGHFSHAAASARVGKHVICHIHAYIGHDNAIGDFVTVAPRASLNGNVQIGDGAYIGAGAMIRQDVSIGTGAFIGMGAVVVRDVPPGVTVYGNPARIADLPR